MPRPKGKKRIRRKPWTTPKMYFTADTQDAIVEYQGFMDIVNKCTNLLLAIESKDFDEFLYSSKKITLEQIKKKERKKAKKTADKDGARKSDEEINNMRLDIRTFKKMYLPSNYKKMSKKKCKELILVNRENAWEVYTGRIQPAFDKLVENLIFIHNFKSTHESYEELKADCVSALYEKLPNFDASKGSLAFSYYNIVAKNFLIIQSKKRGTSMIRNVSLDNKDLMTQSDKQLLDDHCKLPSPDDQAIERENIDSIKILLSEIRKNLNNDLEIKCMNSIQDLFGRAHQLPMLNKRAVLTYIREMTGVNPKQLTTAMSIIKKRYRELKGSDEFGIF